MPYIEIRTPQTFTHPDGLIHLPTPPDLSTGLLVDLDAHTLTGVAGDPVTSWPATGSMGAVFDTKVGSGTSFPILETTGPGGAKAVAFGGTHNIAITPQDPIFLAGDPGTAVVVAADRGSAGGGGRFLSGYNPASDYRNIRQYLGRFAARSKIGTAEETVAALPSSMVHGQWEVYVVRWDGNRASVDASTGETARAEGDIGGLTGMVIGANSSGSHTLTGAIARMQVFDRALSDTDVAATLALMGARYGIEVRN